jgi:hypothetical protein
MKLNIQRGPVARPQRGILYGPEGIGKSTLAASVNPLFLDFEKGTHHMDVARTEPKTLDEVNQTLDLLARDTQGFDTIVIDTIDWLEDVIITGICTKEGKSGLEDFGYGKGYVYLAEEVNRILSKLDRIAQRANVILLAHSEVKRVEMPELPPFDRYQLRLSKSVMPLVKEWADWVLFGNYETVVREREGEKNKALKTRARKLWCAHSATADAKNRNGLKDVEEWSEATLRRLLTPVPSQVKGGLPPAPAQAAPQPAPAQAPAPAAKEEEHIPGLDPAMKDLFQVLSPHAAKVNEWLLQHRRIPEGGTFMDMDAATRGRILANPAGFLQHINAA